MNFVRELLNLHSILESYRSWLDRSLRTMCILSKFLSCRFYGFARKSMQDYLRSASFSPIGCISEKWEEGRQETISCPVLVFWQYRGNDSTHWVEWSPRRKRFVFSTGQCIWGPPAYGCLFSTSNARRKLSECWCVKFNVFRGSCVRVWGWRAPDRGSHYHEGVLFHGPQRADCDDCFFYRFPFFQRKIPCECLRRFTVRSSLRVWLNCVGIRWYLYYTKMNVRLSVCSSCIWTQYVAA